MLKKILVGVAGTGSLPAKIATTLEMAKRHDASVSILSILDIENLRAVGPVPIGAGLHADKLRQTRINKSHDRAEASITEFEAALKDAGIAYDVIREEGSPMEVLARVWRYHDLCVLGVRGWFDHGVVPEPSNTLLNLISQGVRPLFSVTEKSTDIRRVMIAYNGSIESAKAMKQYAQFNPWPDAENHVVCVGKPKSGEQADDLLDRAVDYLQAHGLNARPEHVTGKLSSPVFDHSRDVGADLVVMGSSYRRILAFKTFGTHARRMIEKSDCALFMSH